MYTNTRDIEELEKIAINKYISNILVLPHSSYKNHWNLDLVYICKIIVWCSIDGFQASNVS